MPLNCFGDASQVAVERALSEFRAARPVAIRAGELLILAFPAEGLTQRQIDFLQGAGRNARLIIPGEKAKTLEPGWNEAPAAVHLHPITLEAIEGYIGHRHDGAANGTGPYRPVLAAPSRAELAALALANLSLLLPAVAVADASAADLERAPILSADAQDIIAFRDREARSLKIVARTRVPLEGAGACEFVVFRGGDGFRDQIAIIVGNPSPKHPVLARIHSACLTGDLFGSLKCDCGDQLRGTVRAMSEQGGGIVLYLDQEGRGNGIANKNPRLLPARGRLRHLRRRRDAGLRPGSAPLRFCRRDARQLGFTSVRLMTNNPRKVAALREAGLEVVSTHRVLARATAHNAKYLATKRDKGGHLLGDASLDGIGLEDALPPVTPRS